MRANKLALTLAFIAAVLTGCQAADKQNSGSASGGDTARGAAHLARYGCGACHTIPGIPAAHGLVGPSLEGVGGRMFIAGSLPNEPANLIHWITAPHDVNPRTAMPNVDVSVSDAKDISAYLYTLTTP